MTDNIHTILKNLGYIIQDIGEICNNSDVQILSERLTETERKVQECEFDELVVVPSILVPEVPKEKYINIPGIRDKVEWIPEFNRGRYVIYARKNPNNILIYPNFERKRLGKK